MSSQDYIQLLEKYINYFLWLVLYIHGFDILVNTLFCKLEEFKAQKELNKQTHQATVAP